MKLAEKIFFWFCQGSYFKPRKVFQGTGSDGRELPEEQKEAKEVQGQDGVQDGRENSVAIHSGLCL